MIQEQELKDKIIEAGRMLKLAGLSPGATGNISVKINEKIICTATGIDLGNLAHDNLSVISVQGEHLLGMRPTKESFMHAAAYQANASINAVVHLHSSYATAVSCLTGLDSANAIRPLTPYLTMKTKNVALIPYFAPGDSLIAAPISEHFSDGVTSLLLANHGLLAGGATLETAVSTAQEIEESAKIFFITQGHSVRYLTSEEIATLRVRFNPGISK